MGYLPRKKYNVQISAYANQWRFRSTRDDIYNTFYYFTKGTLTCNDIAKEFIDMIIQYESIGVKMCGLLCDGGGSNESFLRKIVEVFDLDKSISIIHPLENSRRIYFWPYGTHSQKATKNNFFRR